MRGTELQSAASRLFIWLTHKLSSGPGPWDLRYEGLGLPEYLPGAQPVVTGVLVPPTLFLGGAVDPLGWKWGWVPKDPPLKCRSSLRGTMRRTHTHTHWGLNSEGVLAKKIVCPLSLGWFFPLIGTIWTLIFHFHIQKVFSANKKKKKNYFLDGTVTTSWGSAFRM